MAWQEAPEQRRIEFRVGCHMPRTATEYQGCSSRACRCCIGEVARRNSTTLIHHLEGGKSVAHASIVKVYAGHHVGRDCHYHGVPPPLPSYVRIVYIDVRNVCWCSVGSVPFHSFAWPTFDVRKAKSIARTIWTNHCGWASVLVIRGRCWCSQKNWFRSNCVLENLLWRWCEVGRPFMVYKEGNGETGGGDPVPAWLKGIFCVGDDFCQCNLVGVGLLGSLLNINGHGWHHPGMLYANGDAVWYKFPQLLKCNCRYSMIKTHYPGLDPISIL